MHRPTALIAAAVTVLALAACGGDDEQSETTATRPSTPSETTVPPGGDTVPEEISGVHWIFDGYYTVGGLQPLPVTDSGAGLTIESDGTVAIDTGCNQGSAIATFDGQLLQVGSITVTEKACADDIMQIEQMLLGQLEEQQHWGVGDGILSLTAARISDTGLHFHDAANPPTDDTTVPPTADTTAPTTAPTDSPTTVAPGGEAVPAEIVGVEWVLDGYYTVGGLQPLPATGTGAGLTIEADGSVTLDGGCNQGSATATFDGDQVQFSQIRSTLKACADDVMEVEQMLFGQLGEPQYWYVDGGMLQLTAANISDTGLHFHDAAKPPVDDASNDTIAPPHT